MVFKFSSRCFEVMIRIEPGLIHCVCKPIRRIFESFWFGQKFGVCFFFSIFFQSRQFDIFGEDLFVIKFHMFSNNKWFFDMENLFCSH